MSFFIRCEEFQFLKLCFTELAHLQLGQIRMLLFMFYCLSQFVIKPAFLAHLGNVCSCATNEIHSRWICSSEPKMFSNTILWLEGQWCSNNWTTEEERSDNKILSTEKRIKQTVPSNRGYIYGCDNDFCYMRPPQPHLRAPPQSRTPWKCHFSPSISTPPSPSLWCSFTEPANKLFTLWRRWTRWPIFLYFLQSRITQLSRKSFNLQEVATWQ